MMIINLYEKKPGFPFDEYFKNASQYIQAQSYWMQLLRNIKIFDESKWNPKLSHVDIREEMYTGRVCYIISTHEKKEIMINTASVLGDANMLFKENQGISEHEYDEQKKIFGPTFELSDKARKGITHEEALLQAKDDAKQSPLTTWVEKAIHWQPDAAHSDHGYEIEVERLILTSEISERAEPLAIQALELFLQEGPAIQRVNRVFSPDPQP